MVTMDTTMEKISHLSYEQLSILNALLDEFTKNAVQTDVSKRIGIAKGKFTVPENFDDIDFDTSALFGVE